MQTLATVITKSRRTQSEESDSVTVNVNADVVDNRYWTNAAK